MAGSNLLSDNPDTDQYLSRALEGSSGSDKGINGALSSTPKGNPGVTQTPYPKGTSTIRLGNQILGSGYSQGSPSSSLQLKEGSPTTPGYAKGGALTKRGQETLAKLHSRHGRTV